jgi:hypothetical protein
VRVGIEGWGHFYRRKEEIGNRMMRRGRLRGREGEGGRVRREGGDSEKEETGRREEGGREGAGTDRGRVREEG